MWCGSLRSILPVSMRRERWAAGQPGGLVLGGLAKSLAAWHGLPAAGLCAWRKAKGGGGREAPPHRQDSLSQAGGYQVAWPALPQGAWPPGALPPGPQAWQARDGQVAWLGKQA